MNSKIPKPQLQKQSTISIVSPIPSETDNKIIFSFLALEETEYFNLDGTCANWTYDLIEMLKNVSNIQKDKLMRNEYKTYRVHNHETAKPPSPLPQGIELKDFYQIRISKTKGGIHGVFNENIFYVIWLDPLHNMYPNQHYGGLRKVKEASTCCKDRDEEIEILKKENTELKQTIEYFEQEFDKVSLKNIVNHKI